jgi:hypothetical protein
MRRTLVLPLAVLLLSPLTITAQVAPVVPNSSVCDRRAVAQGIQETSAARTALLKQRPISYRNCF